MKILLTGASSYVGARLYFDLSKTQEIVGTYSGNRLSNKFLHLDITDSEEIKSLIKKEKPDTIIHAASIADARWCEANPELAVSLNQSATSNIVEEANAIGAKIIYISSFAAIKPENVYGRTKFESEKYVNATKAGFLILRPSLLIGYSPNTVNDRPFNRFLKNLDEKTEAIYDTSWHFQPSYLGHLSDVIMEIIGRNIWNETIAVAVKEIKTRYEVAMDILGAFDIEVKPVDKQDKTAQISDSLEKLKELKLPQYSYEEIIKNCIEEIKNRNTFLL